MNKKKSETKDLDNGVRSLKKDRIPRSKWQPPKAKQIDYSPSNPRPFFISRNKYQQDYNAVEKHRVTTVINGRLKYNNEFGKPIFKLNYFSPKVNDKGKKHPGWEWMASTDSNGYLSYMGDAHGDLQISNVDVPVELKDYIYIQPEDAKVQIFDYKSKSFIDDVSPENLKKCLKKPHPESFIYDFVVSFEELFARQLYVPELLQITANTIFKATMNYNRWRNKNFELQVALHRNTHNWHIHGRLYQNDETPVKELVRKKFSKASLNLIREVLRNQFFANEVQFANLNQHKINIYKLSNIYLTQTANYFQLASALLDILKIQNEITENKDISPDLKQKKNKAITTTIKNIFQNDIAAKKENDRLWEEELKPLLESQTYKESDTERLEFLETLKNKIQKAFKDIWLMNIMSFLKEIKGQNIANWLEKNPVAEQMSKPDLGKMVYEFYDIDKEVANANISEEDMKRKARYHKPLDVSSTLTFDKMAAWSPNFRKFYKQALRDLGKIFLNTITIDFKKIQFLIDQVKEIINAPSFKKQPYETTIKTIDATIQNILKVS